MTENELSERIVNAAYQVYLKLGPGLLETVYELAMEIQLKKEGLAVERQKAFAVEFDGILLADAFRADIVVESKVIIELKSVRAIEDVFKKQLLTYLRASKLKLGLLINFMHPTFKGAVTRIVNGLPEKE
jgi:GxxExxY protein